MSFKPIPVEKKIEALSRAIAGEKIQRVARKIGIHRTSIYIWKERALAALGEALEPHKRGLKLNDWSDLLYSGDKTILEESLFLSVKEAISSKTGLNKKMLIISNEVRSLAKKELKTGPEGGEKASGR